MLKSVVTALAVVALGNGLALAEAPASGVVSFDALDRNDSGALEGEEAKAVEAVGETVPEADADDDGRLDRSEFEAPVAGTTGTQVGIDDAKDAKAEEEAEEEEAAE